MKTSLKNPYRPALLSALLLHGILVAVIVSQVKNAPSPTPTGTSSALHTYLYAATTHVPTRPKALTPPKPVIAHDVPLPLAKTATTVKTLAPPEEPVPAEAIPASKSTNTDLDAASAVGEAAQPPEALLALLHNAIQQQQHYPEGAVAMHRQGSATVAFVLTPNGTIQQVHLVKTSGTPSLDDAALTALQAAVPFQGITPYVHTAQAFQIAISFELPD